MSPRPIDLDRLLSSQQAVVARRQVLAIGGTDRFIACQLSSGRWRRIHPGVFASHAGPLDELGTVWAAWLWAGDDAAICDDSALRLYGIGLDRPLLPVRVAVDHRRRKRAVPGVVVVRCRNLAALVHPVRRPPLVRLEDALLRVAAAGPVPRLDLLMDACRDRRTTPERLLAATDGLAKLRHRSDLVGALTDFAEGMHSWLERRYVMRVERAHRLPSATRQQVGHGRHGVVRRDGFYERWRIAVELDGAAFHDSPEAAMGDRQRDLTAAGEGILTIRIGYREVVEAPCETAMLVAAVLANRGWDGALRPCGERCSVGSWESGRP